MDRSPRQPHTKKVWVVDLSPEQPNTEKACVVDLSLRQPYTISSRVTVASPGQPTLERLGSLIFKSLKVELRSPPHGVSDEGFVLSGRPD